MIPTSLSHNIAQRGATPNLIDFVISTLCGAFKIECWDSSIVYTDYVIIAFQAIHNVQLYKSMFENMETICNLLVYASRVDTRS